MALSFDQIVLAGPIAAGKSTLSLLVAERLGLPCYVADSIKTYYYYQAGYDAVAARRAQEDGTEHRATVNKPYDLHAVERMLEEFHDCVIDLGAGHACYLDPGLLERAKALFGPLQNTFLILPTRDPGRSLEVLEERIRRRAEPAERLRSLLGLNRAYLAHPSYTLLTRKAVYVEGRGPDEVADEIVARISRPRKLDLLILVGPNGVGKSTVGRCLAQHLGYRFLPVEEFWKARYPTIEEIWARLPEAYRDLGEHVRAELAATAGLVVFESGGRNPHDVELIRSLSESYRTLLVRVHADLETCLRRVQERGTEHNFPKTPEFVTRCHREFESYVERYDFALEIENVDLSEEEVCQIFRDFEGRWQAAPDEARRGCRIRA